MKFFHLCSQSRQSGAKKSQHPSSTVRSGVTLTATAICWNIQMHIYIYTYIQIHRYKDMGIDILIYRLNLENWDVTNNLNVISAKIDRPSERTMDQTKRRHPGQVAFPGFPPIFLSKNREYHEFQNQGIFWYQSLKPHEILGVSPSQPYFVA